MINDANLIYRENEAVTADPVGLVVILYDVLLKDLREAVSALTAGDIERRAVAVRHSMLVLQQLQSTLDMEGGGVVAANLEQFYNFTRAKLLEGQIKASSEIFEQQITFVSSIREAWQQVRRDQLDLAATAASETTPEISGAVLEAERASMAQWSA
jgi:flagellar protein FliS